MATERAVVQCCIAGGGPAGMMAGLLLARAGVDVLVLEKHADFLRDFRGDTIHPSTLEVMQELGILDDLLARPHQEASQLDAVVGNLTVPIADFSHLPTHSRFIALMPQWDFLNFLAEHAGRYPTFKLRMQSAVSELIEAEGRVVGVRATTPEAPLEVRARLVIGADGRRSVVRERADLAVEELGAPMDVLWFRLSRSADDPEQTMGRFVAGAVFVMINRSDYWQCGLVVPKGALEQIRGEGLERFRSRVGRLAPFASDRTSELKDWDEIKLLTVRVDRLRRWYRDGLLCIGDAAHAMSPVGGVGINLAIQDAVATANLIAAALREDRLTRADLASVQRRRELPTRVTQRLQIIVQNRVIARVLGSEGDLSVPLAARLVARFPSLRRIPARLVGIGVRPEHVRTASAWPEIG